MGGRRWPATSGRGGLARRRGAGANKRSPGREKGVGGLTLSRRRRIWGSSRRRRLWLGGFRAAAWSRSGEPRLKKGAMRALGSSTALGLWPEGARDCGGGVWGGDGAGEAAGRRNGEVELGWWRRRYSSAEMATLLGGGEKWEGGEAEGVHGGSRPRLVGNPAPRGVARGAWRASPATSAGLLMTGGVRWGCFLFVFN